MEYEEKFLVKNRHLMLMRDASINYDSPYLTCERCNEVMFLEIQKLLEMINNPFYSKNDEECYLFPCPNCKSTAGLRFGIQDLSNEINIALQKRQKQEEKEFRAAQGIQKTYKGFKVRKQYKPFIEEKLAAKRHVVKAVIEFQSLYRSSLSKQILKTFKNLKRIKEIHPMILKEALKKPNIFWYNQDDELELLYSDYRVLVNKNGGVPSMREIEINISKILLYINEIENMVVTRIQRVFRGFLGRQTITRIKLYDIKLKEIKVNSMIKIQRVVRGYYTRKFVSSLKYSESFKIFNQTIRKEKAKINSEKVLEYYKREIKIMKTSKYIQPSNVKKPDIGPISAKALQIYKDFTKEQSDIYNEEKNDRKDFLDKYEKMKEKCKESSVYRHYYAIEQSKEINRIVIDEYLNKLCSKPNFPYK